jgi:hypothetical protein
MRLIYTKHARDVIEERELPEEWILRVVHEPAQVDAKPDGTTHYLAPVEEFEGRILRVVIAGEGDDCRLVTVFFDRRQRRKAE